MNTSLLNKNYSKILKGKTVSVVGGSNIYSPQIVNKKDLVCRINNNWTKDLQGRIDLLYHQCLQNPFKMTLQKDFSHLKFVHANVCLPYENDFFLKTYCEQNNIGFDYFVHDGYQENCKNPYGEQYEWLPEFRRKYNFFPLTGILAIYHILMHDIKSLYITGMTLYQENEHIPASVPKKAGNHWMLPQIMYLLDIMENDDRVIMDNKLETIIKAHFPGRIFNGKKKTE